MTVSNVIEAKFNAECAGCEDKIDKGQFVTKSEEGWIHDACAFKDISVSDVCHDCFTVRSVSGACGCIWD